MRFTINREYFLKGLNIVTRPIPTKSFVASLVFVKVSLDNDGLTLIGSNETIAIQTIIPFKDNEKEVIRNFKNGAILVSGKMLFDIVRKVDGEEISFEVIDDSIVEITDNKTSIQLNSAPADEYPEYDFNEKGTEFHIDTKELIALVEQTSFAAATKENRPMLTALNIVGEGNKITAAALDAARYSRKDVTISTDINFVANIPSKTINEIIRMFEDTKDVNIVVNDKKMFFKFNTTIISSNLLNGEYPNIKTLVPKTFNYFLEVNAQEFLAAIDRVSLLSNEKCTVKLVMSADEVEVSSTTSETGSAKEKIPNFNFTGDRLEILFNANYVIDAIKALRSDDIVLQFIAEMKPFTIKSTKDENIIELITPVRV